MFHNLATSCHIHVEAARPVLSLLAILSAILGLVLTAGGIYLAFFSRLAESNLEVFGVAMRSTSVGVSMAFIGAAMFVVAAWRILRTLHQLAALPPDEYYALQLNQAVRNKGLD